MSNTADAIARNATTARTLSIAAGACLALGMMVGSPAGAMFGFALAALFALPALGLARGRSRVIAAVLLVAALGMAFKTYPVFEEHMADYSKHSRRP